MRPVILLAAVVCIGFGAGIVYRVLNYSHQPGVQIEGVLLHDAGIVKFSGAETIVEHEYTLINRTHRTLYPEHISLSCGCLNTAFDMDPWLPSESRTANMRMTLRDFSKQVAHATIHCRGEQPIPLTLTAIGSPDWRLKFIEGSMILNENEPNRISVRLLSDTNEHPPQPDVHTEPEVEFEFTGWAKELGAIPHEGVPARHTGVIVIGPSAYAKVRLQVTVGSAFLERTLYR